MICIVNKKQRRWSYFCVCFYCVKFVSFKCPLLDREVETAYCFDFLCLVFLLMEWQFIIGFVIIARWLSFIIIFFFGRGFCILFVLMFHFFLLILFLHFSFRLGRWFFFLNIYSNPRIVGHCFMVWCLS